jgi:DNA polymerase III subunit delta'
LIFQSLPWHQSTLLDALHGARRLPHALLLRGASGIGKTRYAQALAASLLCETPLDDGLACGRCLSCGWVAADTHPDLRQLTRLVDDDGKQANEIKIDQVRALSEFLGVGSHRGGRRLVLIDPADAMNHVTANALLKTLEEPGNGLFFILVANRPDALAATIRSRCQSRLLASPSPEIAGDWIKGETGCSNSEAQAWLAMAGGSPLQAIRFAEPAQASAHRTMLEAIARMPDTSSVATADALQPFEGRHWLPLMQRWLLDLARCRLGGSPRYFPAQTARLLELSARTDPQRLADAGRDLAGQYRSVGHPLNPRLFCEESLAAYLGAFGPVAKPGSVA